MIPVDTVKTRIVMQNPDAKVYSGILDCLRQIVRKEGVGSLYKVVGQTLGMP